MSLETVFWILLLGVVSPAIAVGGTLWVRRAVGADVLARHNEVAGFVYAVIGVVYAVLLGFTAIIVWEEFREAQKGTIMEANAVADLYRSAQVFPADVRAEIETGLRNYAQLVLEDEWPAMEKGKPSSKAWDAYNELWRIYHEFKPQDENQRIWYVESVQRMNALGEQRRSRLLALDSRVPVVMWVVLLGAGALTVGFSFLFGTANARAHALITVALTLTIGGVLFSIVALEQPFAGITRIGPDAFEQVLAIIPSR
jgi:hypothetical protein